MAGNRPRCGVGQRDDWGDDGVPMAWVCTEGELAYQGDEPVVESMADALEGIVGHEVYVELRTRLSPP